jgi:predicted TPR repeat methyltransferase
MAEGSVHIKYKKNYRYSLFDAYIRAITRAAQIKNKSLEHFRILDLGCGRGEFLEYAVANGISLLEGVDFDPVCVKMSSEYAPCHLADINRLDEVLDNKHYDLIVASHVLEHLQDPKSTIEKLLPFTKYFIIAVPNPLRPNVIFNAMKRYNYSNLGHYYAWDRSHFTMFIKKCGLEIIDYYVDDVRLPSNRVLNTLRRRNILGALEKNILAKLFPYFATSLIVLCSKNE